MTTYDESELEQLEEDEHTLTIAALLVFLATMSNTRLQIENELHSFYQKYGKDGVVTYAEARKWVSNKDRRKRLNVLLLAICKPFDFAHITLEEEFQEMLIKVVSLEAEFFGIQLDIKALSLKWGYDNLTWSERLAKDVLKWNASVMTDIKRGILQRKHLDDILVDIAKRFDSVASVLETLATSETTAVGSITRHEIFKALGIDEYKFYTRDDEQTCEVCGPMHGRVFPMSAYEVGVTASPMHPRCRCWEVPIIKE